MKLKNIIFSSLSAVIIMSMFLLTACNGEVDIEKVNKPNAIASNDELHPSQSPTAVENSENVNGRHFTTNLEDFTSKYNLVMMDAGGTEYLYFSNWKKQGEPQLDVNGVEYQLWYYNQDLFTLTTAVETKSQKIMNLGCGTTMSKFVMEENGVKNSDIILRASAVMAASAGGFNQGGLDVLQDIFYRTTFEGTDSLWYDGNVYSLTTKVDSKDNNKSTMMFRFFPISEKLRAEWNVQSYDDYMASLPAEVK